VSELNPSNITRINEAAPPAELTEPVSIRVSLHSYLTAVFIGTYAAALSFYIEADTAGALLFVVSWIILPFLALRDRIQFDGRSLSRTGWLPRFWAWFNRARRRLKVSDVEQVETHAVRTLKRSGNIYYRYRTVLRGKGISVTIASGSDGYRRMIQAILAQVPADAMDVRSLELLEHLKDPKETLMKAELARIPSPDALRSGILKRAISVSRTETPEHDPASEELRELANELKAGGHLTQALEAFRRALRVRPSDGRLLFEFARCLHSFAAVERDPRLERKALAALRLSERRSESDNDLLVRLGEFYFQVGEWRRAGDLFQKVIDRVGDHFLAARGMAEIALRDGKIAHVVHHFSSATRAADNIALRRWAREEADYFSNLNSDDEYMEMEVSRVNLFDGLERSKTTALRIASLAFPAVIVGLLLEDEMITLIGWTVSTIALVVWIVMLLCAKMFSRRIPYQLLDTDQ
jgi:tetratricopeptide (TPR) repeat protein